jgi:surfactin synthase thioesterase subunit
MADRSWLVRREPRPGAALRLVCLPSAGANAGAFDPWCRALPDSIEVCAVQLPGRQERFVEPPCRRIGQVLTPLEAAVAEQIERPYVLFGVSLGATVAFELARAIERHGGHPPVRLVLASARPPHVAGPLPAYAAMPDHRFLAEVTALGVLPEEVSGHEELRQAVMASLRADFELGQTYRYRPGPPVDVPIDAVTGLGDVHVPLALLQRWSELTTQECTAIGVPGEHNLLGADDHALRAAVVAACEHQLGVAKPIVSRLT